MPERADQEDIPTALRTRKQRYLYWQAHMTDDQLPTREELYRDHYFTFEQPEECQITRLPDTKQQQSLEPSPTAYKRCRIDSIIDSIQTLDTLYKEFNLQASR